jgi:endonuclease/exonuclease/phosphatase (EEP) superfamily protein YafD
LGLFLALDEPAVLVGDLNTGRGDPAIQAVLAAPGVVDPVGGERLPDQSERIDWILVRGLRGVDAGIRDSGASDHPLIWAELEVATESDGDGPS